MEKDKKVLRLVLLAMLIGLGVVISPILRIEGMCPMAHLINIVCAVLMGPWYALLCATLIGIIRMTIMGIPPLALTGAVFGAVLSGLLYRASKGKIICAVIGEIIGTGIIGAVVSYPVMEIFYGRTGLSWMYYVPMFISGTLIGGSIAFCLLMALSRSGTLREFQQKLGIQVYEMENENNLYESFAFILRHVEETKPLIHCITHPITMNDCANLVLAVGASPNMASHPEEAAEFVSLASVLAVNLGNIADDRMEGMQRAAARANELGIPILIDAVGVSCSTCAAALPMTYRDISSAVIKGNSSEIRALCGLDSHGSGVDAGAADAVTADTFAAAAEEFGAYAAAHQLSYWPAVLSTS